MKIKNMVMPGASMQCYAKITELLNLMSNTEAV